MRIVFLNLNSNEFYVRTLPMILFKRPAVTKHRYILDYLLQNDSIEVCNYINEKGFSLSAKHSSKWYGNILKRLDNLIVFKTNKIGKNVKVLLSADEIKEDDILIAYSHYTKTFGSLDKIKAFKAVCVLHLIGSQEESAKISSVNPDLLFGEYNVVKHSRIFQNYYGWYKKSFITHPFTFASRFKITKKFEERDCLAFSPGTIIYTQNPEYEKTYGTKCFQIYRKQILDNKEKLKDYIACYNSEWCEDFKPVKVGSKMPGVIKMLIKFYNTRHMGQQKKYFSFDMVERYNNYKMFVCGEETTGSPAVGFVEGMACGSALIGNSTIGCYEDYGMIEGVHYIGYDGSIDDLVNKIKYYQEKEHQDELRKIAEAGYIFSQQFFTPSSVASRLIENIIKEYNNH